MKKLLLFLAEGFEEVEAVTPIDFMRRAGIGVVTVGIGVNPVSGAHGIKIEADIGLSDITDAAAAAETYDGLVFPGGMPGAENIAAEKIVSEMIEAFNEQSKIIAAICASPGVILAGTSVLDGRKATCYPGFESRFSNSTQPSDERVVIDGNIITSRGPGTAAEFSIELIRQFAGDKTANQIRTGTLQNV